MKYIFRATYKNKESIVTQTIYCSGGELVEELEKMFGEVDYEWLNIHDVSDEFMNSFSYCRARGMI